MFFRKSKQVENGEKWCCATKLKKKNCSLGLKPV